MKDPWTWTAMKGLVIEVGEGGVKEEKVGQCNSINNKTFEKEKMQIQVYRMRDNE